MAGHGPRGANRGGPHPFAGPFYPLSHSPAPIYPPEFSHRLTPTNAGPLREPPAGRSRGSARANSKRACELRTSQRFGRYLRTSSRGLLQIDRSAVKEAERYDGKWVAISNDDTLSPEDIALGYKQLMRVEECWRQLKSGLRLRPVFHYRPWRIQAHVSLTVLGLLLERIAEIRTGDTWRNIRDQLNAIKVVEYEHAGARVRQTTELPASAVSLLKQLKIAPPPLIHQVEPVSQS